MSPPPYSGEVHHEHSFQRVPVSNPFPLLSPPSLFHSGNVESLTRSGEILVYYIQQWHQQCRSRRAVDTFASGANFCSPPCLKFTYVDPSISMGLFTFMGSFTCMKPFRFCVALLHLYSVYHYYIGPFHPREPAPGGGVRG